MNLLLIIFIVLVIVVIALAIFKARRAPKEAGVVPQIYYLKKSLFSPAERSFFGVLEMLDYEGITIACKVRLGDVFGIKKGLERGDRQRAVNRITGKHVDFLLIQSSDGRPLLGVELDDSSHEEEERRARDSFVDSVFLSTGLPILHVVAKAAYDPREIHRQIDEALAKRADQPPQPAAPSARGSS